MVVKNRYGAGGDTVSIVHTRTQLVSLFEYSRMNFMNLGAALMAGRQIFDREFWYFLVRLKRAPHLNAYAERFVRTIKESCLERMILFGEESLRRAIREFVTHYHLERNHQGLDNQLIFPENTDADPSVPIECRQRLCGMLNYYYRQAA